MVQRQTIVDVSQLVDVCARSSAGQRVERVARAARERDRGRRVRRRVLRNLRVRSHLLDLLRVIRASSR